MTQPAFSSAQLGEHLARGRLRPLGVGRRRPAALPPPQWKASPGGPRLLLFLPHSTHHSWQLAAPRPYRTDASVSTSAEQGAEKGQQATAPPGWGSAASSLPPLHSGAHPCTCSGRESRAWPTAHAPRPERWDKDAMQLNPAQFFEVITKSL